jgi:nitroreductase
MPETPFLPDGLTAETRAAAFDALVRHRRATYARDWTGEPVDDAVIERLLDQACQAPTHKRTEPWRFIVLREPARARLGAFLADAFAARSGEALPPAKAERTRAKPLQASAVIAIVMARDPAGRVPEWEEIAATAMAVQNLWLGCTALGLTGYWSSPQAITEDRAFLGLEAGERCLGLFYLGTPAGPPEPGRRAPLAERVRWMEA